MKNVYPCKPQFYYIIVGYKGVNITRTCYHDGLFNGKCKFGNLGCFILKGEKVDFSDTIAACDLKVGRCRQLIEFMKARVCEY